MPTEKRTDRLTLLLIALGAALVFIPFLGSVRLFDWDEVNFAESAREMIETGNYTQVQINFEPFWEKPPLFFWFQVAAMKLFGINEFAARFPNAICGIITLLLLYRIGSTLYDRTFGMIWTLAYFGSFLPHFYFSSGIIDPWFNLFIFLGVYFLFRTAELPKTEKRTRLIQVALAGLFTGLGILTKGPVALLMTGLCAAVYLAAQFYRTKKLLTTILEGITFVTLSLLVTTVWFGYDVFKNGIWFLQTFIEYQIGLFTQGIAGHEQPFYYHLVVLLFGVFPSSFLALRLMKDALILPDVQSEQTRFMFLMMIFFLVPLVVFSISKTKIVHYSSLCYFGLTFLAAQHVYEVMTGKRTWGKWSSVAIGVFGSIVAALLIGFPLAVVNGTVEVMFKKDRMVQEVLKASVSWSGMEWLIGAAYLISIAASVWILFQKKFSLGFGVMFFSTALTLHLFTVVIAPKIDRYVQGMVVDFYESKQTEDCYIQVVGFKSYAYLFYPRKRVPTNPNHSNEEWLLNGEIDKPTYIISKITRADNLFANPNLKLLKSEAGFVIFERTPKRAAQ
jgi:4-amino-4-deoxy-L-arabinose transferase-like glycosyltransferase